MDIETDNPEVARIGVAAHFTELLLETLPEDRKAEYRKKFIAETFNAIYSAISPTLPPRGSI